MRILLLQDEIFLPTFAGGTKANRCLLEELSQRGHQCFALTRALTRSPDGPNDLNQLKHEIAARGIQCRAVEEEVFAYEHQGVRVEALNFSCRDLRRQYLARRIRTLRPDCVFVADDKRRFMLSAAVSAAPGRAVPLLQTVMQLPFGPLSVHTDHQQTCLMSEAPEIVVISKYLQEYLRVHGGMASRLLHLPVYGAGPFVQLGRYDFGFVTMINPCELKGVALFLALARAYPEVDFAAVPTWGADDNIVRELSAVPNVCLLEPSDRIEDILARTRILLVPSLWPETFGYVVPEAMLRGIPVLASNLGGLPEAKLGVDYLLPVRPAQRCGDTYVCPPQDTAPWSAALGELLRDRSTYEHCSLVSRQAALTFASRATVTAFETLLEELASRTK